MKILAFASPKAKVAWELSRKSKQIEIHLIKCGLFPYCDSYSHWKDEVFGFINDVDKLKNSNRFPSSEFIMKNTWKVLEDTIFDYTQSVLNEYRDLDDSYRLTDNELYNMIEQYFIWLSEQLSRYGRVINKQVDRKIDELVGMY